MANAQSAYELLLSRLREVALLRSTASLLSWDQEVLMPSRGVEHRGRQLAQIAALAHEKLTDKRVAEWLNDCESSRELTTDPTSVAAVNLREIRRSHDQAIKVPESLVREFAETATLSKSQWAAARQARDFVAFRPWLTKMVALSRRKAECFGWADDGEPWDALADDFEPRITARQIEEVFIPLRDRLVAMNSQLLGVASTPPDCFQGRHLSEEAMRRFVEYVAKQFGFDFSRGRLDTSTHPFCAGFEPNDVRMTTRFDESNPIEPLFSTMHETGHGIYNQSLPLEHHGTPMGESVSLGIHESQSRLWENQVGRSSAFWSWCAPRLREFFGADADAVDARAIYASVNLVRPGFIRVEADEATYNLHIMLRFELERELIKGDLDCADLPQAWNRKFKSYLGIVPPDDAVGCLQDIHWSQGAFGYFPSYALGNLYASQLFARAEAHLPELDRQFERGQFGDLKAWLNENIHRHGMRYRADTLCERVTGEPLHAEPLLQYLERKLKPIYGL